MRRNPVGLLLLAFFLILSSLGSLAIAGQSLEQHEPADLSDADAQRIELGKRMYREGLLPSGKTMSALIQGDIEISGEQVICGFCHRRSGIGSSEGQDVVSPVTGDILYQPLRTPTSKPPLAPVLRPAYTDATLKRAIREGIDSANRPIKALMPRYPLNDQDLDILIAYLKTLNTDPSPGVTDHEMHFATVIPERVDPAARKAFLDVFQTYLVQKNTETRNESQRAEHAPRHKEWQFGPYRKWVLHVWELKGAAETWPEQLSAYYQQQPVFAVMGGILPGSSEPLHEFCQSMQLPCVFPITDLPVIAEDDFYVVYLSKGMTLEAQSIAQHLATDGVTNKPVVQVYRDGDRKGQTAAAVLQQELEAGGGKTSVMVWDPSSSEQTAFWASVQKAVKDGILVLWLNQTDLASVWAYLSTDSKPSRIYLSTSIYDKGFSTIPTALRESVYFVQPSEFGNKRSRLLARSTGWLRFKKIYDKTHEDLQADAFFTLKMMGEAVKAIHGYFVRDYLLERLENMVDNASYTSIYPRVSLAPGQRFVVKGAYITKLSASSAENFEAITPWTIPQQN